MHRRHFLELLAGTGLGLGLDAACPVQAAAQPPKELRPLLWITGQACLGCTASLLNLDGVDPLEVLSRAVRLAYHSMLLPAPEPEAESGKTSAPDQAGGSDLRDSLELPGPGSEAGRRDLKPLLELARREAGRFVLVAEGAAPLGEAGRCCLAGTADGRDVSFVELVSILARQAWAVLAVGTCASYGGAPAARLTRTGASGISSVLKRYGVETPIADIPGCPPHPQWFLGTLAYLLEHGPQGLQEALDRDGRPKFDFHANVHDACPLLKNFEQDRLAEGFADPSGCRYNLGCAGPQAYADCPARMWNGGLNWCVPAGVCLACAEPVFPDGVDLDGPPPSRKNPVGGEKA